MLSLPIRDDLTIPAADLTWRAVRASGPGGQNVNKVASKVELRFDVEQTAALTGPVKARLRAACASRLDADGRLVVVSQRSRDQARNLELARERLRELVLDALEEPKLRRATKPTRASQTRRVADKRMN